MEIATPKNKRRKPYGNYKTKEKKTAVLTIANDSCLEGIERRCIDGKSRTKLYFAHPYTACERGTNENHNRIFRRFFPKGCDFSTVTDEEVQQAENWMNNYP